MCYGSILTSFIYMKYICNNKYFIYLLSYQTCGKQYVGNTTNHFNSTWNNHKSNVRKDECGKMENVKQNFSKVFFNKVITEAFLKI